MASRDWAADNRPIYIAGTTETVIKAIADHHAEAGG